MELSSSHTRRAVTRTTAATLVTVSRRGQAAVRCAARAPEALHLPSPRREPWDSRARTKREPWRGDISGLHVTALPGWRRFVDVIVPKAHALGDGDRAAPRLHSWASHRESTRSASRREGSSTARELLRQVAAGADNPVMRATDDAWWFVDHATVAQ